VFPASVIIHRRGRALARLVREADYQEMVGLMAEHLKHLADEGEKNAIPLYEVIARLEQRREVRRRQREGNLCMAKTG
jgi:anti-sigma-K factor RskA